MDLIKWVSPVVLSIRFSFVSLLLLEAFGFNDIIQFFQTGQNFTQHFHVVQLNLHVDVCHLALRIRTGRYAEYESAKERQSFIEGRIAELEGKLSAAQIIDPAALDADGRVVFGATVQLEDIDSGDKVTYQIVGEDEADLKLSKISVASPLARALIGKYAGDVASFQAPGGEREYEILDVLYR